MRFCVLGSGSKGNCTFVEAGATRVLIDAGFSGKEIERRLASIGVEMASLSSILVTHEHTDHIRGVAVLSRRFKLPVYATSGTFGTVADALVKLHAGHEFAAGESFSFQDIHVHPFSISHDAADPVGFIVSDGRYDLGYCTDTGLVSRLMSHRLAGCHGLILESNHDPDLLKNGPYPPALKQRVRSKTGHLANPVAVSFLSELLHDGLQHVVLAHISETNNSLAMVRQALNSILFKGEEKDMTLPDTPGNGFPGISLALQEKAGEMIGLSGSCA